MTQVGRSGASAPSGAREPSPQEAVSALRASPPIAAKNTDRLLWRGPHDWRGEYYGDSVSVTEGGGIAIDAGGTVVVKTPREWVRLAQGIEARQGGDASCGSVHESPTPRSGDAPEHLGEPKLSFDETSDLNAVVRKHFGVDAPKGDEG